MTCTKKKRLEYTEKALQIVAAMSLEEKVDLMSGKTEFSPEAVRDMLTNPDNHYNIAPYPNAANDRLGVPSVRFCDGPRGVVCGIGKSTCYPVSMCRGATFDIALEEEIGRAIGREVRAWDGNLFAGVCINLPYNPGWGRSQETYGEDSFAIGSFGAALTRGVQEENVIACVKHYAFNSMENSRFKVSIECDRRTEREVYLPHFKDCVDAGAAGIMSAYNLYKGVHCGHHDYLLRKVLKEEWDFDGFVMSDFIWGVKDTVEGANNGEDMEMCATIVYGDKLVEAVREGLVDESRIDESALRIVRTVLAFEDAYKESGRNYGEETVGCQAHINLALRAAREGITLIKNKDNVLPFNKDKLKTVAVIGKLAALPNIGDYGSSRVYPAYVITPLDGLRKALPGVNIVHDEGTSPERVKKIAAESDAVVFVVGYNHNDEGEYVTTDVNENYTEALGGDRKEGLGLHKDEVELIQAAGSVNQNTAVVLIGGNVITITEWMDCVPAILMAYYPGQEGGTAIAEILLGDVNPGGKLPFVLHRNEADLPQVVWETTNQFYQYYHGYAKMEKDGIDPLLPYGYGLSYTTFAISDEAFSVSGDEIVAGCSVENTGDRAGDEVIQLYVGFENSAVDRPVKSLRGFKRVSLQPGEKKTVTIRCPKEKLEWYNPAKPGFELEQMAYQVYIGTSSSLQDLIAGVVQL